MLLGADKHMVEISEIEGKMMMNLMRCHILLSSPWAIATFNLNRKFQFRCFDPEVNLQLMLFEVNSAIILMETGWWGSERGIIAVIRKHPFVPYENAIEAFLLFYFIDLIHLFPFILNSLSEHMTAYEL